MALAVGFVSYSRCGRFIPVVEWHSKLKPARGGYKHDLYSVTFTTAVLTAIIFSSIAVNWHRFILRNEVAEGSQRLRLDGLVWHYFLFVIAHCFDHVCGDFWW